MATHADRLRGRASAAVFAALKAVCRAVYERRARVAKTRANGNAFFWAEIPAAIEDWRDSLLRRTVALTAF